MQTNNLLENQGLNNNLNGFDNKNNDVMVFAEILCELSRYNSDLKAILENSKLSANQNQNEEILYASNDEEIQNTFLNNVDSNHTNEFKTIKGPYEKGNDRNTNNTDGNQINISGNNPVTAGSIYDLLTSGRIIFIDISKLPEELKQLVNRLVNNNSLDNQNEIKTLNMNSAPLSSKNNILNPDEVVQKNQEKLVNLKTSQFQDLIYYFIINTVAKDKGMSMLSNQNQDNQYNNVATNQVIYPNYQQTSSLSVNKNTDKTYGSTLQTMSANFYNRDINRAYQAYTSYRNSINENVDLRQFIKEQKEPINFWGLFLLDVLKRASFFYSLYKAIWNNRRENQIDAILGLPHVLFILSLIFGWGAIASTILGLAVLASLVYKAINQYQQTRPRYLLYSLLKTKTFYDIADRLDYALVPEVGNLYKFYKQNADQVSELLHNEYDNRNILMKFPQQQNQQYSTNPLYNQNPNF